MRPKEIKKLIELVETSTISELEVRRFGQKVRISKQQENTVVTSSPNMGEISSPPVTAAIAASALSVEAPPKPKNDEGAEEVTDANIIEIKSPMVGTFYSAPAPDADPYVQEGDIVTANQVLCIIEAMKLMNEIESELRGRIVEILGENGKPVEYDQVLFRLAKL